jgi:hypothetical protein
MCFGNSKYDDLLYCIILLFIELKDGNQENKNIPIILIMKDILFP